MAGYIFNLNSEDSLRLYAENGVYATILSPPRNDRWGIPQEGTFADYATMAPGDNVYFFIDRKIYGIGELVEIGGDCKYANFPGASAPIPANYPDIQQSLLWDEGPQSTNQRWLCVFRPSPHFFMNGIDMDEVLTSNPNAFKSLRAFWKVSFIKFDDNENQAFKDILLKRNLDALTAPEPHVNVHHPAWPTTHARIEHALTPAHRLDLSSLLLSCAEEERIRHEMAIEAGVLFQLSTRDPHTVTTFGAWDYITHQTIASPFKPIDYMDKMDVFGYSYIPGFRPTIQQFHVMEIKKDSADQDTINQVMKYVDWINEEYAHGDYRAINAYIVAAEFSIETITYKTVHAVRQYTTGRRPARSLVWNALSLVRYRHVNGRLRFEIVA